MQKKTVRQPRPSTPARSSGGGHGAWQSAADRSPVTTRLTQLNARAQGVAQRVYAGSLDPATRDSDMIQTLAAAGYETGTVRPWKVKALRESKTEYTSLEEIALALSLEKTSGTDAESGGTEKVTVIAPAVVAKVPELKDVAEVEVSVPKAKPKAATASKAKVPSAKAHGVASRWMAAAKGGASKQPNKGDRKPMVKIDRAKILAPRGDELVVYRAEKAERNTLEDRRKQGGLNIWQPSSANVQEAYEQMFQKITGGKVLSEFDFKMALNGYAQDLRAEGQPDNLATGRTIVGAFVDDYNYTIKIPGVRIFEWTPKGIGARVAPGAEIKTHYIVLNADTLEASTIFGFGHYTGTQEVSFYTNIPGDMIDSVQEHNFQAKKLTFKKPAEPEKTPAE